MQLARAPAHFHWQGEFPPRNEVPTEILYEVALEFRHNAEDEVARRLRDALNPIAGRPKTKRRLWGGKTLRWSEKGWPIKATLRGEHVTIDFDRRVKGKALTRFVEALATVPGAQDLRIEGQRVAFKDEFEDIRACTPCMAATLRK